MTDDDPKAIYSALLAGPPVKHFVANGPVPSWCEVCQEKHGLGELNKIPH